MEIYLGLGSNLGDKCLHLRTAINEIEKRIGHVECQSAFVETEPWGFESERSFTNRAYVFKDADKKANIWVQMAEFFGGRLATFVLFEWLLNLGVVLALGAILPEHMEFLTVDLTPYRGAGIEIVAMGIASVCNIVANYIIGKFLVFEKAKHENEQM